MEILIFEGDKKENLELMCDFKQPIFFQINTENEKLIDMCNYDSIVNLGFTGTVFTMNDIKENGLASFFESDFLRPSLNRFEKQYTNYTIHLGEEKEVIFVSETFLYDISHRQYFLVTQGAAVITLIPPIHGKILKRDYHDLKFEYNDTEEVNTIPVTLKMGDCLFIPALWGYRLSLSEKSSVTQFHYKSLLNIVSYLDYYALHFLQKMNTKYRLR